MDHGTQDDLTALLDAARAGGEDAKDRLVRAVYGELRRMTIRCLKTIRCPRQFGVGSSLLLPLHQEIVPLSAGSRGYSE